MRERMASHLREAGYIVFEAANFRQAADELSVKPHLVILDMHLPDATGWDVAEWLEQYGEEVPIIVTSGTAFPSAKEMQRFHPQAFLRKPYSMDQLVVLARQYAPNQGVCANPA